MKSETRRNIPVPRCPKLRLGWLFRRCGCGSFAPAVNDFLGVAVAGADYFSFGVLIFVHDLQGVSLYAFGFVEVEIISGKAGTFYRRTPPAAGRLISSSQDDKRTYRRWVIWCGGKTHT